MLTLPLAAALAACTPADGARNEVEGQDEQATRSNISTTPDDCLLMVWSNQESRDIEFDRANDLVEGGAISCATGTSPSKFNAALEALREAARAGDKARMLEQVGIPLVYIDKDGNRIELEDETEIDALFDDIFRPELVSMLERVELKDMTVVPEEGGFFELGSLWLVVDEAGGKPLLVTVNQQALDEAAEAARRKARNREGEPVEVD